MRRNQGLPLNTIVLAAIAVLVLVLIVGFTTGTLGELFKGMSTQTRAVTIDTARAECQKLCSELKLLSTRESITTDQIENSAYAKQKFAIDLNRNGRIDSNETLYCWQPPINEQCVVQIITYDQQGSLVINECKGKDGQYKCQRT